MDHLEFKTISSTACHCFSKSLSLKPAFQQRLDSLLRFRPRQRVCAVHVSVSLRVEVIRAENGFKRPSNL
jgi:hypothetical protein